ncbi:MAG: glucose-1-phosphate cytidylyltransferase [Acutalibacteraceae bacterium]|nr:glucose-1-phosphate cytidylyltransferase [Acutalibacteraceae bacterium]
MKVVILAGGYGTRISEESEFKPKPMISLDNMPILWHIMKIYSHYGFNEFVICAGYKQHVIKEWFANYFIHTSDVTFDFTSNGEMTVHNKRAEKWKVTIVDTGLDTMTGGRLKRVKEFIGDEPFFMTYGDGVSDVNIEELLKFHKSHDKLATITAVKNGSRFGVLDISEDNQIKAFREKSVSDSDYINAGFMVLEPAVLDYIDDDTTMFEIEPLKRLVEDNQIMSFKHDGFWQCMDTLRDKQKLGEMLKNNKAPWKVWED